MELHERLAPRRPRPRTRSTPSPRSRTASTRRVIGELGPQLFDEDVDPETLRGRVIAATSARHLGRGARASSRDDRERLVEEIADDILGYGPIERLLADDSVTEIMVNGPSDSGSSAAAACYETTVRFTDDSHLRRIINKIVAQVGRRIDESSPMVDARLPDGTRVNAIIPPLSLSGPLADDPQVLEAAASTLDDLVRSARSRRRRSTFLEPCVQAELNILVSGGTGSGKTTLLNALSSAIPTDERIVTIEDAAELQLNQHHVVRLESRPAEHRGRRARSPSATWSATPCACGPTASSSARSAAARRWTCSRP